MKDNKTIYLDQENKFLLRDVLVAGDILIINPIQQNKLMTIKVHLNNDEKTFEFELDSSSTLKALRTRLEENGIEKFFFLIDGNPIRDIEAEY